MSSPIDTRPLTEPVNQREAQAFERAHRKPVDPVKILVFVIIGSVATFVFGIFGFMMYLSITLGETVTPGQLLFAGIAIGLIIFVTVLVRKNRVRPVDRYRISQFAAANGLSYMNTISNPPLPGMLFRMGDKRRSSEVVRGERQRFVEFGNYRYTSGHGRSATFHQWGYVAVKLDVPLPHIVLDAVGNNSALSSNLPFAFDKGQKLSLEGDFNRHFTLYCPQGYETDALYLFTPDIMAQFIRSAAPLDVEIIDDWMFFYTRQRITTADPATWIWLIDTVDALMTKLDQWARWRDDRLSSTQPDA